MSEPFLAEIRMVGFNFAPKSWAFCNGQIIPINQNQALFSLLGVTYGGDGRTTFALPDLRGRVPVHMGTSSAGGSFAQGQRAGEETHTLSIAEMAAHTHTMSASDQPGSGANPSATFFAANAAQTPYAALGAPVPMATQMIANAGAQQAHPNIQPYLAVNFCIALQGMFPSRS